MGKRSRFAAVAVRICALVLGVAPTLAAQEPAIRVLCSNGIKGAMEKIVPDLEHSVGRKISIEFGVSANLKKSIEGGEAFDLAILTPAVINDLMKQGKVAAGTNTDIASSNVGIAVRAGGPKPDVKSAENIKEALLKAKTVGYVKEGGATQTIVDMINRLGITGEIERKTSFQSGADQNMESLAQGKTDLAMAPVSEIIPAHGVQLAGPLPSEFQKPIIMTAGVSSSTKNRPAVTKLIDALRSPAAVAAIKSVGMDPIAPRK